jgi:methylmalonyl-CoA mutase cobalamin-binding domain/chain
MPTHKERILAAMRGEMADVIPFVPRLDLWWLANVSRGTLPEKYRGMMPDDISRAEGWACYHMVPNFADVSGPEDVLHRSIGLFQFKQSVYGWRFSPDVEIAVEKRGDQQVVEYRTSKGSVRTVGGLTRQAMQAGSSLGWVEEHAIKKPEDYRVVGHIFANIEVFPQYESAQAHIDATGDDGVAAAGGPSLGASPMHMIQKEFLDPTQFFYHYRDHQKQMRELAECVGVYFEKALAVIEDSPAEVVLWGANYDDVLTYPPYFEKEILPWLIKISERLRAKGKIVATHTDGENRGLMDLIRGSGVDVAESVTPWPMTQVRIEEYYRRWRDKLTIMGGIPESVLLEDTASEEEFEAFLDALFAGVAPGDRLVLGTADSTPPDAEFERLHRIQERVEREGRLPLQAGSFSPIGESEMARVVSPTARRPEQGRAAAAQRAAGERRRAPAKPEDAFAIIRNDVIAGDETSLKIHSERMLKAGCSARDILHQGMTSAMEIVAERFKAGEVFIPEVLIAARAMNQGLLLLEPYLAGDAKGAGLRVLIATVYGDMHDIGKNMVAIMLRGVGFEVRDIGVSVSTEDLLRETEEFEPRIIGLSALLTTTMPEMRKLIEALGRKGLRDRVKILVGGAPVNQRFADEIGADAYVPDAGEAVEVAKSLVHGLA